MALKTSTFAQAILSNAARMVVSSSSHKILFCIISTAYHNQFRYECSLLYSIRKNHRISNKINDSLSPLSELSSSSSPCLEDVGGTIGNARMTSDLPTEDKIIGDQKRTRNSLDHMVNSYPAARRFITTGSGGDDFADAMVLAVQSVLHEPIPDACVRKRVSSMGRYISVNIGRVQVKAVYEAMMKDARMRYFF